MTTTWIIGADGLLGGAMAKHAADLGDVFAPLVDWSSDEAAIASFRAQAAEYAGLTDSPRVLWCAGAGVTNSPAEVFEAEMTKFRGLLAALEDAFGDRLADGVFTIPSSSAVYAGVDPSLAPFPETVEPRPLAPYGQSKLNLEAELGPFAERTGCRIMVCRLSALYGPGQNLTKTQGLATVMLANEVRGLPTRIFVSMDTIRDYLLVNDAARLMLACTRRMAAEPAGTVVVKNIASGRRTTISELVEVVRGVLGREPLVETDISPDAVKHPSDITLASVVWPEIEELPRVPLEEGLAMTHADLITRLA